MRIAVSERRGRDLSRDEFQALRDAPAFWELEQRGYLSLRASANGGRLLGGKYVGRATFDGTHVEVVEKVSGALAALVSAATGAEVKTARVDSPASAFDVVSRALATEFVNATGRYIASRRKPRYSYQPAHGPTLGGTLDIARTIELHAQGFPEAFAYTAGRVVRDEPLDRLVLAGLEELHRAGPTLGVPAETLYRARWLAGALHEVRDARFMLSSRDDHLAASDHVEGDATTSEEDVDLARLAAVALLHQGFGPTARQVGGSVPRALFLDLETLFEQAVRETLRGLLGAAVDRGEQFERRLFIGGSDHSRTYPDLVVHRSSAVLAVGDVKYKSLRSTTGEPEGGEPAAQKSKKAGRPDLYQVLIHAAAADADRAFVIYVSDDTYRCGFLGRAATGCRTWVAQVRPLHLTEDIASVANAVGLT